MTNSKNLIDSAVFTLRVGDGNASGAEVHFALPADPDVDIKILPSKPTEALLENEGLRLVLDESRLTDAVHFLHSNRPIFEVPMTVFFDANTGVKIIRMASYSGAGAATALVRVDYSVEVDGEYYSVAKVESVEVAAAIAREEILRILRGVELRLNPVATPRRRF
ncbi:hypothetical protein [Xanthomonas nasturtii]|uniref:Uncharacterized protein n=1 Tax=Xanthomonas nasturtii TaxID=1843581 RepID=A0ABT0LVB6_9XANT|nr:hypothetical protein [Xanthomonas nasturtii]MCL1553293.1 hypothetical protein [Xanthomonas nasturtii]MCL1557381.1 hypothetical protein [Xanthomonas nasturtii]